MSPKLKTIGFGSHGHVPKSKIMETRGRGFPKVKSKSYESQMKQNNSTQLLGQLLSKIEVNMTPQTPNPEVSRIFNRKSVFFRQYHFMALSFDGMSLPFVGRSHGLAAAPGHSHVAAATKQVAHPPIREIEIMLLITRLILLINRLIQSINRLISLITGERNSLTAECNQ